jgi:plasmid stabilization system protein ParE
MYTVEFTDEAIAELRKESKFSESKWGKKHARKYFSDFRKKLKGLGQSYRLYKTHDEILQGLRL